MNDTLTYIMDKWDLDINQEMPIEIPETNRTILTKLFCELGYREGAEIGTLGGHYARDLKRQNPDLILYCVDPWKIYDGIQYFTQEKLTQAYNLAVHKMKDFKDVHFIKKTSMDAVKDFNDNSLDFVHIDAHHEFPYVAEDIFYWSKKVKAGGIVSGHDYHKEGQGQPETWICGVREAVEEYTEEHNIYPWFVMDDCTLDRCGSFFWVKP